MDKVKRIMYSEKGMKIVNLLFLFSAVIRNCGIIFVAYICWIIYLRGCVKRTEQKVVKRIYMFFVLVALFMIMLNLYFMLRVLCA